MVIIIIGGEIKRPGLLSSASNDVLHFLTTSGEILKLINALQQCDHHRWLTVPVKCRFFNRHIL